MCHVTHEKKKLKRDFDHVYLSMLTHITNHNINYVHTSALQRLNDAAISTKIKAILISQCMQTYCTRKSL